VKAQLEQHLTDALGQLVRDGVFPQSAARPVRLNASKNRIHGDYVSNLALQLEKPVGQTPYAIAAALVAALPKSSLVSEVKIAQSGFINFFQAPSAHASVVKTVIEQRSRFGHANAVDGQIIGITVVNADERGPHSLLDGRVVALGECLARLFAAAGQRVSLQTCALQALQIDGVSATRAAKFERVILVLPADCQAHVERLLADGLSRGHLVPKLEFRYVQPVQLQSLDTEPVLTAPCVSEAEFQAFIDDVGHDAARFFFVMRKYQQRLAIDKQLACSSSLNNPLYYVQYANARVCSVFRQLRQRKLQYDEALGLSALTGLTAPEEAGLLKLLAAWPDVVVRAASLREPNQVSVYLRDLANGLHTYYSAQKFSMTDKPLHHARLTLLVAVKQVLINGLSVLDVSAPEVM